LPLKRVADEQEAVVTIPIAVEPVVVEIAPVVVAVQYCHMAITVVQTEGKRP